MDELNNRIITIQQKMTDVENEKNEMLNQEDCIDFDILESKLLELEKQLNLETDDLLKLQEYQAACCHTFVDDLIDITPDKSKTITYCVDCLFTPED